MKIDFEKMGGLVPAIIQDATTRQVLMLGFMNEEAYQKTLDTGHVTFWSRTRQTLWTKGETSGHFLNLVDMKVDCDEDTLLVRVNPIGPTCHTGTDTCWGEENEGNPLLFLSELQAFINQAQTRDARRFVHHKTLQGRHQQDSPESGRRSVGDCD